MASVHVACHCQQPSCMPLFSLHTCNSSPVANLLLIAVRTSVKKLIKKADVQRMWIGMTMAVEWLIDWLIVGSPVWRTVHITVHWHLYRPINAIITIKFMLIKAINWHSSFFDNHSNQAENPKLQKIKKTKMFIIKSEIS